MPFCSPCSAFHHVQYFLYSHLLSTPRQGGAVATWDRVALVQALARDIMLHSWARHVYYSHSASLHPLNPGCNPVMDQHDPSRGEQKQSQLLHATETSINSSLMGHFACMQTLPLLLRVNLLFQTFKRKKKIGQDGIVVCKKFKRTETEITRCKCMYMLQLIFGFG